MTTVGPTFLILGVGRSGTTGLAEGLKTHPGVFITTPKEPHYFALHGQSVEFNAPGDEGSINRLAVTDRDDYLRLYPRAGHEFDALGDAAVTSFYYFKQSIPEILKVAPDSRLVVLLREPVERAHSAFGYLSSRGLEPCGDFLDAVADEERRVADNWQHLWHYTRMSKYASGLEAFQNAFGRDRVGVWFYDDLQDNYELTVKQVLRFIGTSEVDGEGAGVPRVNASGNYRNRVVETLIHAITRNEAIRAIIKKNTSYRFREAARRRLMERSALDDAHLEELSPIFRDDLIALQELVDMDRAPAWLRNPA